MLIKEIKTAKNVSQIKPAGIATIVNEVKQHGFYSAYCDHLFIHITEHSALIHAIQQMAADAGLRVTFNAKESICIFEEY